MSINLFHNCTSTVYKTVVQYSTEVAKGKNNK